MRRLALGLSLCALASTTASANADPPVAPVVHDERIEGPFPTLDAYCAFRGRQYAGDSSVTTSCEIETIENAPAVAAGQAIRAYRFVRIGPALHVAVETRSGWLGRSIVWATNGDTATVENVTLGSDHQLVFDVSTSHAPCGCDDLFHDQSMTHACTVQGDALLCSDGVLTRDQMHLVDIWSWSSTLSLSGRGTRLRATRTIVESDGVSQSKRRQLARPIQLTLHR
jgi:hypothetical protein